MAEPLVSEVVIDRLPLYLRMLQFLEKEGKQITSSQELAERLGFSSAQIRKDLSYFGEFGKQGTGYNVAFLQQQLRRILHVDQVWDVALIGVGDLGHALANYRGFLEQGFRLVALFDNAPTKIGRTIGGLTVQGMTELARVVRERNLKMVILAVPVEAAQKIAEQLVELGVRAILNYAPITLSVPPDVRVHNIDPVTGLQSMAYYLK
jgi:redox-sensing transcriptional repressor